MGIQIGQGETQPAVVYDRVHVTNMMITQPVFDDHTQTPKYSIEVYFRLFGLAGDVRYYEKRDVRSVVIDDYIPHAMVEAQAGDMRLINALGGIEQAVAAILEDQLGWDTNAV